jgi:Mrp family chromosome partitioning ATPase
MGSSSTEQENTIQRDSPPNLTEAAIFEALSHVQHPEVENHDLIELGMIPKVKIENRKVTITLALPFRQVPIRDELVQNIRATLASFEQDVQIEIDVTEMTPEQRATFMALVQGRDLSSEAKRSVHNVVAVMSGKGGVGKSSIAGLLACAIRRHGLQVGVLDADITGPSIPRLFGIRHMPTEGTEGILPPTTKTGIKLISINLLLPDEDQPVVWRGPLIGRVIQQFWSDIAWGDLDYLIVDLPPGTSDAALTVMQSLPVHGIVLVTSPQDLAGMIVRKAAKMAMQLGLRIIGLVENMSYFVCPDTGKHHEIFGPSHAEEIARTLGIRLLGSLPLDPEIARLCDQGRIEEYSTASFSSLVENITAAAGPVRPPLFPSPAPRAGAN